MFKQTFKQTLPILPTSNHMKGGDFMGPEQDNPARQRAIEDAERMSDWERAPRPGEEFDPIINNPDQGRVLDERQDPTHPLRRGRIRPN